VFAKQQFSSTRLPYFTNTFVTVLWDIVKWEKAEVGVIRVNKFSGYNSFGNSSIYAIHIDLQW